jgi:hypothetical protein
MREPGVGRGYGPPRLRNDGVRVGQRLVGLRLGGDPRHLNRREFPGEVDDDLYGISEPLWLSNPLSCWIIVTGLG